MIPSDLKVNGLRSLMFLKVFGAFHAYAIHNHNKRPGEQLIFCIELLRGYKGAVLVIKCAKWEQQANVNECNRLSRTRISCSFKPVAINHELWTLVINYRWQVHIIKVESERRHLYKLYLQFLVQYVWSKSWLCTQGHASEVQQHSFGFRLRGCYCASRVLFAFWDFQEH